MADATRAKKRISRREAIRRIAGASVALLAGTTALTGCMQDYSYASVSYNATYSSVSQVGGQTGYSAYYGGPTYTVTYSSTSQMGF